VVGSELTVIANTGDDVEVYGVHVSPDPDLVTYWLADAIDERGYGIRGDTWEVMQALDAAGRRTWFRLGDRDLAMCLVRTQLLRAGERLTRAHAAVVEAMGVAAHVLPMSDEPVRTRVRARGRWRPFQEFMIVDRAQGPVEDVSFDGAARARPTPEALDALAAAEAIVIGPSNPIASVGPVLALPGMREAIAAAPAPVVAVSPFVGGHAIKGPTEAFAAWAGLEADAAGVARAYAGLLDGLVADEEVELEDVASLRTDTLMDTPAARGQVAATILEFAGALTGRGPRHVGDAR
jgi:LPPG:FO 2-phospho-L-lactate transferase